MSVQEIDQLLRNYRDWLKHRTTLREINGAWVEITTPYLDRHNDALQIYARRENGSFVLTDDSYVIHDLEASGCKLDTQKCKDLLQMTLNGFGVKLNQQALEVVATRENFPMRKHNLIQAMLAVNDLFYLAKPVVESVFYEDVIGWLDANDIRYTPNVNFTGISGYDQHFHFAIPKSKQQPERILQAITRPNPENAMLFINAWSDTKQVRSAGSRAYAMLNDTQPVSFSVVEALRNYDIRPVPWQRRIEVISELAS
jgi:hypothetical protein